MHNYTIISIETAKLMLKVLKDRKTPLKSAYHSVSSLMPSGWPAMNDVYGVVGSPGSLCFEGGSGDDWKQMGLDEEHWLFGEADLNMAGCFKDNSGGQYLTRDDMIVLVQGHINSLKPAKAKVTKTMNTKRTLAEAEREISRLKTLLTLHRIKF